MTESEWLQANDPGPMMEFLRGKASERKMRLFACASCRTVWPSISGEFREAIRLAEEHVDGRATSTELGNALRSAHRLRRKRNRLDQAAYDAARSLGDALGVAQDIARVVAIAIAPDPSPTAMTRIVDGRVVTEDIPPNPSRLAWEAAFASHLREEALILRDIIGPLLFRQIGLSEQCLAWHDGTIPRMARRIYEERCFEDMPILADALEDAGCCDEAILTHCRGENGHVRGCWVLDLLLSLS